MLKNLIFLLCHFIFWMLYFSIESKYLDIEIAAGFAIICSIIFIIAILVAKIGSNALQTGKKGFSKTGLAFQIGLSSLFAIWIIYNRYISHKLNAEKLKIENECYGSNLTMMEMFATDSLNSLVGADSDKIKAIVTDSSQQYDRIAFNLLTQYVNKKAQEETDTIFCLKEMETLPRDTIINEVRYSHTIQFLYSLERKNEIYYALYACGSGNCDIICSVNLPQQAPSKIKLIDKWLRERDAK